MALLLAGCPAHPGRPPGESGREAIPAPSARHLGRPYDVVAGESLLTLLVYRGGPLARAGHNHVIASHEVSGTIYVPSDPLRTTFEVRVPVAGLTIDEPALRASEGADFSAAVPDSAREGTRRNMLGEALLNAQMFPQIVLRSERLEAGSAGAQPGPAPVTAHMVAEVRGSPHSIAALVTYDMQPTRLTVSGELLLKQTDLGLTPFSALLGALQVEDEMRVRFRFVARPAPTSSDAGR